METLHRVHVSLNTDKFDESVTFYRAFLGREPKKLKPGYAKFELDDPGLNLTLNQTKKSVAPNALSHLGLQVSSSDLVQHASQRLVSEGLATFDEKDTTCCYAVQDKVWATDPTGNRWEVFVVKEDVEKAGSGPVEIFGSSAANKTEAADGACCAPDCCT